MKVALLEASHWHTPLYLDALAAPGVEVRALSDSEKSEGARRISERFKCPLYESYEDLLSQEQVDFAFAFGRHSEMPSIAEKLIEKKTPFALEKPCGVRAEDVARLRRLADAAGVYAAVPFIFRLSDLISAVRDVEGQLPSDFNHLSFRFIVGPPSRYENGASWMLEPAISGGGPTINVGIHFIDLFRALTGAEVVKVSAVMSARTHGKAIEDFSLLTLHAEGGIVGVVETGYTFPSTADEQREFSFTLGSRTHYLRSGPERVEIRDRCNLSAGTRTRSVRLNTDDYYPVFVRTVLEEFRSGKPPIAGLQEAEAAMRIVDAAYESARQGGVPQVIPRSGKTGQDT
jgi:predicted dehydrogenase